MASGRKEALPDGKASLGVPRRLMEEVDRFIAEYPEFGIKHRNDFAARAIGDMLRTLRKEVHERILMDAYKAGKPGPIEELKRMKS